MSAALDVTCSPGRSLVGVLLCCHQPISDVISCRSSHMSAYKQRWRRAGCRLSGGLPANWDRLHLRCPISCRLCSQLARSELCFVTNEVKPKAMHFIYLLVFENCCSLPFNSLTFIYKGLDKLSWCIMLHLIRLSFVYMPSPPVNLSLSLHSSSIIDPVSILEGTNSIQFEVRQCRSPTIRLILHFHVTCSFQVLLVFKIAWNIIMQNHAGQTLRPKSHVIHCEKHARLELMWPKWQKNMHKFQCAY